MMISGLGLGDRQQRAEAPRSRARFRFSFTSYFNTNLWRVFIGNKCVRYAQPGWLVGLDCFLTSLRTGMNKIGWGRRGRGGGWQLLECCWTGKLWAFLLQVAVRGGSPAKQEIAGEGKEGLTTTTTAADTREKKQDTGGIQEMGVLFELWSLVV